jgi:hypothetical protein
VLLEYYQNSEENYVTLYVTDTQNPSLMPVKMRLMFHLILKEMGQTECIGFKPTFTFTFKEKHRNSITKVDLERYSEYPKYTQTLFQDFFTPFCLNALCQFTPPRNFLSLSV